MDLAQAHAQALGSIDRGTLDAGAFNLGNGEGFSVREVVAAVAEATGSTPPVERAPRRPGDPAILVASADRAQRRLGWKPEHPELSDIVRSAWNWHRTHPDGYGDR
jgi:UDP-glucose 4-epimerase